MTSIEDKRKFLADVIVTAVEGGIGYWSAAAEYRWYYPSIEGGRAEPGPDNTANAWVDLVPNDDEESDFEPRRIAMDDIEKALQQLLVNDGLINTLMRRTILRAWIDLDAGEIDADGADAIVQIAMFGKVVYG